MARHVLRIKENGHARTIVNSEPCGKRGRGRPKQRWADGVVEDLVHCVVGIGESLFSAGMRGDVYFDRPEFTQDCSTNSDDIELQFTYKHYFRLFVCFE